MDLVREVRQRRLRIRASVAWGGSIILTSNKGFGECLLRAAERFRRIKRHGELGTLVTALGAGMAEERAA